MTKSAFYSNHLTVTGRIATSFLKSKALKWKMQKHPWWAFGRNDPWVTTTNKRINGKRVIFLTVSLTNQSDWICSKETRIHWCRLHEIWMEGERHTQPLCLWRDELCGSQPHMQIRWLHFNEAQLSERLLGAGANNERSVGMFRPNPHFYQSMKMTLKEKSTLRTTQGWISLREDCGIAVRKLSLTFFGSHILPHSLILGSPWQRYTNNMKKSRRISTTRVIDIEKSSFNPLFFTTTGGVAPECNRVNKRLAEEIAEKRREPYASVITYIRTKLKAQICSFEEHPCCNTRISRQTKWCPHPRPHGHWLQLNSQAHSHIKLNDGVNDMTPVTFAK